MHPFADRDADELDAALVDRGRGRGRPGAHGTSRPLVVTADPDLLEEVLRVAATSGTEPEVCADAGAARRQWSLAPLVVLGADAAAACVRLRLPRRPGVVLLGSDSGDAGSWQQAVQVGAEHVVFLPDCERWLADRFADSADGGPDGLVVAVVGGCGGAGATTLACALAVTAARTGRSALLVDGDPLGGGVDLVLGAEHDDGLRWSGLAQTRGRVPSAELTAALPTRSGLSVLSFDRVGASPAPIDAVAAVLAAGRRACELVVVDLPRSPDDGARIALQAAAVTLLVVPLQVRAVAAAACVAAGAGLLCADLRVVVRGPAPGGLTGAQVERSLSLPVVGELKAEPNIDALLERGEPPGQRGRGPLAGFCVQLLEELLPVVGRAA